MRISPTDNLLKHTRVLSEAIGPRGSTTEGERRGAEYCYGVMEHLNLRPRMETFQSAKSIFHPHLLGGSLMLVSFILYPFGGQITALLAVLLAVFTLASELLELGFINNPFRWVIPQAASQNVFSVIPPSGEHKQDLILIGHIDTQRTPLIFRSPTWVKAYKTFTTIAFILFVVQIILFTLGFFFQWSWVWPAAIPTAVSSFLLILICLEADQTPFTAGANDNATAVSMVLTLSEQLSKQPLEHTRVFAVCTGCEEVQHYGAVDFYEKHRGEMVSPRALVFEMLGCSGPGYMTHEGIIIPFTADPGLVGLAEQLAHEHPEWDAYPVHISGGNTELADCVRVKVPGLTLFGLTPEGEAPYWHQVGDTYDKIKPAVLEKTYALTWALIEAIDRQKKADA